MKIKLFSPSGIFIQIVLKTRESVTERTIQYVGLCASIISIIKVSESIITKILAKILVDNKDMINGSYAF